MDNILKNKIYSSTLGMKIKKKSRDYLNGHTFSLYSCTFSLNSHKEL